MKKLLLLTGILLLSTAVIHAQEVGTDRELHIGVQDYKTYAWAKEIDQIPSDAVFVGPNGVMVFNNQSTHGHIKEAIQYELDARGYKMVENNPDFLVNFVVTEQPAEIMTYNGYHLVQHGMDTVRTEENVEKTPISTGTVMINFIDFKTSQMAWRGFASGALKPDMVHDQSKIRGAISSIFQEYNYTARENK